MSSLVSASTNLTLAIITIGTHDVAALTGYGAGSRLEFVLVSLSHGTGGPAGILIGTNVGAGNSDRAVRVAWIGVLIAMLTAETVGLLAAVWPAVWLGAFSDDPAVLVTGSAYLRTVGPVFGFFGVDYALYCAARGSGRMGWPVTGALVRASSRSPVAHRRFASTSTEFFSPLPLDSDFWLSEPAGPRLADRIQRSRRPSRQTTSQGDKTMTAQHRVPARRRVVTGHKGAKAVVLSDTELETCALEPIPKFELIHVWAAQGKHEADPGEVDAVLPRSALPPVSSDEEIDRRSINKTQAGYSHGYPHFRWSCWTKRTTPNCSKRLYDEITTSGSVGGCNLK